jgi:hypothetical protein
MARHGHLFFPSLLPREAVLEARAEALALCRGAGWIAADAADPLDAAWSGCEPVHREDDPRWTDFYRRWINAPVFQSLPEHSTIVAVAEKLLGADVLVHPRKIGRVAFPRNEGQHTPVHQDFFHVRGTTETHTAWVPLGDVHSLTMHQALPNRTQDQLRVSVDNRYQRAVDEIDLAALKPHI